ncbi:hypothetical protein [Parabacteroides sp. PF5-6]|uniref:hypothetical protein n=1 Tax=Parabacteroides sp. PF5-6 TaxID=1742403 RepID=UPI002404C0A5|nr:hypothetical protein [Parabacteroides sp. PF5-6]MDF9830905.1 hypothetical protein [Parabacteroides sp. PF5-6]
MKVLFLSEIEDYLFDLTEVLYQLEYFGFKENAVLYITELIQDITLNLHHKQKRSAPHYFSRYGKGMSYAVFKKNKNTQWYVFFNTYHKNGETIYLIRFVGNNHSLAQYLM